ncbi:hypothetical protein PFISCL1PPCAC_3669, partial [Pristionchus fissidentatus]
SRSTPVDEYDSPTYLSTSSLQSVAGICSKMKKNFTDWNSQKSVFPRASIPRKGSQSSFKASDRANFL